MGTAFLVGTYFLNGGSKGRDFLIRYFSVSAVTALWVAIPFQATLWVFGSNPTLASLDWFVPMFVLLMNAGLFAFIAYNIHDVASRSSRP